MSVEGLYNRALQYQLGTGPREPGPGGAFLRRGLQEAGRGSIASFPPRSPPTNREISGTLFHLSV